MRGVGWPAGLKGGFALTFDVDAESAILAMGPAYAGRLSTMSHQAYGPKVGVPRILELLERHRLRATFFIPGLTADRYPGTVDESRLDRVTIPLAELLLTKLQVVHLNEKDQRDIIAILYDHPVGTSDENAINASFVAKLLAADWGLWRTTKLNTERTLVALSGYGLEPVQQEVVEKRLADLWSRIEAEPKSTRWKLRARIGDRVRWYEDPEEVG